MAERRQNMLPEMALGLVVIRCTPKLREVLSAEDATRLPEAAPAIKYKAAFSLVYGAGLRVALSRASRAP